MCVYVWVGWGHSHASETRIADAGICPVEGYLIGCIITLPSTEAELNIRLKTTIYFTRFIIIIIIII